MQFIGGETQAYQRLKLYLEEKRLISTFYITRNNLEGSDSSSKLSPWISNGCLSIRILYYAVKENERKFS